MRVSDLISILEDYDGDAEVRIMSQPSWPFEYAVTNVVSRPELVDEEECECECGHLPHNEDCEDMLYEREHPDRDKGISDVFIVEGRQICYGDKNAWS